jgi:hypothetical protein
VAKSASRRGKLSCVGVASTGKSTAGAVAGVESVVGKVETSLLCDLCLFA